MRPLEIMITLLLAVQFVWPLASREEKHSAVRNMLLLLTVLAIGIHLLLEGYRWQMVPMYSLAGLAVIWRLAQVLKPMPPRPGVRRRWPIAGLVLLALATVLPTVFPVPRLPKPTGPHGVGTVVFSLTDASRPAVYSQDPEESREIVVQIWYPAAPTAGAKPAAWIQQPERVIPAASDYLGLPSFLLGHLGLFRTHSMSDAPLADDGASYPVLLFSHGWSGLHVQNTYQMEELASHGYVIAAVSHTYGALVTLFPDGRVIFNNPEALPTRLPSEELEPVAELLVSQWSADLALLLDHLEALNASDGAGRFAGRLDLDRVGVLGHSTGGGATIEFCGRDDRCRAALAMDPFMLPVSPAVQQAGLDVPFIALFSEGFSWDENDQLFEQLVDARSAIAYKLTLAGTVHYDFTDVPLFSPLSSLLGLGGEIGARRLMEINRAYSLAFFDRTLRGLEAPLLIGPSSGYPEVSFDMWPPTGR